MEVELRVQKSATVAGASIAIKEPDKVEELSSDHEVEKDVRNAYRTFSKNSA